MDAYMCLHNHHPIQNKWNSRITSLSESSTKLSGQVIEPIFDSNTEIDGSYQSSDILTETTLFHRYEGFEELPIYYTYQQMDTA